ncbi:MAG TPA: GlsB/YeaQ/YmgE family stress response membrane protein [Candidatus Acidoferrum sp.]|nr:GlsB/YeaQ/YmgE family stress response membrane protein [Candidatus Acidoferrum sp.]
MHILWSIVVGFLIGLIARAILPGAQHMGFFVTAILGIVGSFVGGFIGSLISKPEEGSMFHPAGLFLSIVGAVIVLFLWTRFM